MLPEHKQRFWRIFEEFMQRPGGDYAQLLGDQEVREELERGALLGGLSAAARTAVPARGLATAPACHSEPYRAIERRTIDTAI